LICHGNDGSWSH